MRFYSIVYPGHVQLPKETFLNFHFEQIEIKFLLRKHLKSVVIFDAFNEFVRGQKAHLRTMKTYELTSQQDGRIYSKNGNEEEPNSFQIILERLPEQRVFYNLRCSHLFFIVNSTTSKHLDFDFAERLLEFFITVYRRSVNDVFVESFRHLITPYLLIESGICELKANGHHEFHTDSVKCLWDRYMGNQLSLDYDVAKAFETVQRNLNSGNTLDHKEIFIKAQEEIYLRKNFKYALLEVFIFVEQIVFHTLRQIKLSKGISNSTIKSFSKDIGISYMINVELPLIFDEYEAHRQLFLDVDKIRKKRNDVVHNNEDVSEAEAKFAVETAYKLYTVLNKVKPV